MSSTICPVQDGAYFVPFEKPIDSTKASLAFGMTVPFSTSQTQFGIQNRVTRHIRE